MFTFNNDSAKVLCASTGDICNGDPGSTSADDGDGPEVSYLHLNQYFKAPSGTTYIPTDTVIEFTVEVLDFARTADKMGTDMTFCGGRWGI